MSTEFSKINFHPWVGKSYYSGGIFGKKILVLGESHYCKKEYESGKCRICCRENLTNACAEMTHDVIAKELFNYKGEKHLQTFICFERAVLGKGLSLEEREEFWNSIMFYNYLQYSKCGPREDVYISQQWEESHGAFREILETYSPDYIIVWGVTLYNRMPKWDRKEDSLVLEDGKQTPMCTYEINGKKIPTLCIYHPSSPIGKSWNYWHQFYKIFLNLAE